MSFKIPGQSGREGLQGFVSMASPMQSAPPCCGSGLVQFLFRSRVPLPHVAVQEDHSDHTAHTPSTEKKDGQGFISMNEIKKNY